MIRPWARRLWRDLCWSHEENSLKANPVNMMALDCLFKTVADFQPRRFTSFDGEYLEVK